MAIAGVIFAKTLTAAAFGRAAACPARSAPYDGWVRGAGLQVSTLAVLHLQLHAQGPGIDYVGVFVASFASWLGLPGPGEAALIAAGISAAHDHLDLTSIIAVAWIGATAGGMAGWIVGVRAGRGVLTAPGPLHGLRLSLIARGDRFYERYGMIAVLFTPSWIAGIHKMHWPRFVPVNAVSALVWAIAIGLGAYAIGPSITDVANDAGLAGVLLLAAAIVIATIVVLRRRFRRPS
jgi:membrane protein DedA with SNARE-associated domain